MTIEETIKETDRMIAESKETLHNMKIIGILVQLRREIKELAPCIDCETEYNYLTTNAEVNICQEVIKLINNKIKEL
jgi:hypothetical protein